MIRFLSLLLLICGLLAAPYVFFQTRINEAFLAGEGSVSWNVVRSMKFLIYGISAPAIFLGIWFKCRKRRELWISLAAFIYLLALLVVVNYYDYFGMVPHWNQLGNLEETGNLGGHILSQLIGWEDVLSVLSVAAGCALLVTFLKKPSGWLRFAPLVLVVPALALLGVQLVRYPILNRVNGFGYTLACSHYGIWPTYLVMLKDFLPHQPRVVDFPRPAEPISETAQNGKLHGQNVIILQVESLDAAMIGRRIGGKPVMPFLEKLASEGVYFPHCVAMHSGGGSSDAELGSLLSLVPLTSGSGFSTADWNRVTPVSHILNDAEYTCVALHSNRGSFFERSKRYRKMGFQNFYDQTSFQGEAAGWYAKDAAFFEQGIEKLKAIPGPFLGYFITMQSHGPFQNYDPATRAQFTDADVKDLTALEIDYLCSFREVDQALKTFFNTLEAAGLRESTLVVIHGDHESGVMKDHQFSGERVPLVFLHPALESQQSDRLVSHMDIAPTVVDLLGLSPDLCWLGRSVFSDEKVDQIVLPAGIAVTETASEHNDEAFRTIDYSKSLLGQ